MAEPRLSETCPACGRELSRERGSEGLCPVCLLELALADSPVATGLPGPPDELPTAESPSLELAEGQVLGRRYRVRSRLGRGGMGEVWRAFDLKLRVDVALKALTAELLTAERALELLRGEVRAAREVISPNVCRIFDLVELEGRELVSMEYIDGTTLAQSLRALSPLELAEARSVAAQFLAGLEAIHQAGLVHRDVKPENVMITRSGRVVVMDFGIAKGLAEAASGPVAGTPAYMSPEQARGERLDARADVFSAGVVLAEMVAPDGSATREARQEVWRGVHQDPPELKDSPWQAVLARAVAHDREERFASASVLARALEEVTLRAERVDDLEPYPGLAAFTEENSDYFFGRELEVETLWKKLRRPHLLALIGPSGAGKSSFLRAGLIPALPAGWSALICTPGRRPFVALAGELAGEISGDADAVRKFLRFEDPDVAVELVGSWRQRSEHALIIVDQFEELFTLNPPELQGRFADLLGRLTLEADVHVLLSMRDDFLFQCQEFRSLAPLFDSLTPIGRPVGAALRRAVVQPALKCGYRFEDEGLVDEMVAEVGDERGALPMLAFAAARLWEKRDRADGLLTREAYEQIGGVAGCLAQHAEATLERIGTENTPVLRELFRNLVTARGTRAAQDREELLSVFEEEVRQAAAEVLDSLVDARLLTSYEVPGEPGEGSSRQRVEIIHESLLSNWPRLVRWQAQDEEGALLRDQLRQAAQIWDERGRPEDLLWTGTSYREYELWSARYRGGLSRTEDSFAAAMKSHAERHKRRRRMGIAAVITLLSVGLGVVGMFWRQAAISRDRAETETLRAEANQLLALGRLQINTDSTGALAYALASLERADDPASRLFALEALGRGPAALILERGALGREGAICVDFSPDGKWLVAGYWGDTVKVWPRAGDAPRLIELGGRAARHVRVGPRSELVISRSWPSHDIQISSLLDGRLVRTLPTEGPLDFRLAGGLRPLLTFKGQGSRARVEAWSLEGGGPVVYGELGGDLPEWSKYANPWNVEVDPAGTRLAFTPWRYDQQGSAGSEIFVVGIDETAITSPRLVGRHAAGVGGLAFGPQGKRLASADDVGEVRIWDLESRSHEPQRVLHHPPGLVRYLRFDKTGTKLAATSFAGHTALWSLEGPPDAGPLILRQEHRLIDATFHPSGDWLATASSTGVEVWPLGQRFPRVLSGHGKTVADIAFLPDGNSLASVAQDGTLRLWPLSAAESGGSRVVFDSGREGLDKIVLGPLGRRALVGSATGTVWLVSLDGAEPRQLADFDTRGLALALGEHTVVASGRREGEGARIWDLDTGESRTVDPGAGRIRHFAGFTRDGSLALASVSGIYLWDPEENTAEILSDRPGSVDLTPDGRFLLAASQGDHGEAVLYDLEAGTAVQLDQHGPSRGAWLDAGGKTAVTAPADRGFPRFGLARGGPTHLLASHDRITDATVSLDGRWIALVSAAGSTEIGLWPAPDLSQPPPHTLAHDQLLARLRSLTNLRVVADPDSDTGWGWALNPFPGWEEMPEW